MNAPFFSVIIPTFNRRESLRGVLEALVRQEPVPGGFEVIVAADGSTDGTGDMVCSFSAPFALTFLEQENSGASRARNAGAALANGKYLAFTEDDVEPASDWLAKAYGWLTKQNLDILEGLTAYAATGGSVRRFEPPGIASFIPCNLFIRRSCFSEVGGYESGFFDRKAGLYFREDADLGFRLLDKGFSMYIAHDVRVTHPLQFGTLRAALRHAQRYQFDPLLYKRHPLRYRAFIEVKKIAGFTVRRPQHWVAVAAAVALCAAIGGAAAGIWPVSLVGIASVLFCGLVFRFKYQGTRAFNVTELPTTLGFVAVPFMYLIALVRGCIRYRTFGVLW